MKTILTAAMIGLFLLPGTGEIQGQQGTNTERLYTRSRVEDLINTLYIVRNIDNVDHTDTHDRSLLMYASANGYKQACRILIRRGADPDLQALDGATAAMFASYNGHTKIVKLLLESGINPDMQALDGTTALMMASQNGHTEIAKMLLDNGAKSNLHAS